LTLRATTVHLDGGILKMLITNSVGIMCYGVPKMDYTSVIAELDG